jgi:hypothetical protein
VTDEHVHGEDPLVVEAKYENGTTPFLNGMMWFGVAVTVAAGAWIGLAFIRHEQLPWPAFAALYVTLPTTGILVLGNALSSQADASCVLTVTSDRVLVRNVASGRVTTWLMNLKGMDAAMQRQLDDFDILAVDLKRIEGGGDGEIRFVRQRSIGGEHSVGYPLPDDGGVSFAKIVEALQRGNPALEVRMR